MREWLEWMTSRRHLYVIIALRIYLFFCRAKHQLSLYYMGNEPGRMSDAGANYLT